MTNRRLKKAIKRLSNVPSGVNLIKYVANKIHAVILSRRGSLRVAHPSTIMIEVTNHCNLHCTICPRETESGQIMDKGYMDIEKLKKIVDEAFPYIDSIGLTGLGETYLYKDIIEAVSYIKKKSKGIIVSCSINAHLKNSVEITEKLVGIIDTIQVSMDGLDEVYNKIRVGGDFNIFAENLSKIAKMTKNTDTHLLLNVVLVKENYHQMADIVKFAGEVGVPYVNMRPISLAAEKDVDTNYGNVFFTEDFRSQLDMALFEAKKILGLELTFSGLGKERGFRTCKYPWNYFTITWDGYVPLCCGQPFPKLLNFGNVFEDGLMNCLNSEGIIEIRKMWKANQTPALCANCSKII